VRSEADCNVGGHVGLPFVWRRAIALAGALKGRRKAPKAPGAFGSGGKKGFVQSEVGILNLRQT
jgi:hypothetical protein